jgi:hypothetical protein
MSYQSLEIYESQLTRDRHSSFTVDIQKLSSSYRGQYLRK